jgi:hypothetical protein
MQGQAGGH